MSTPQAPRGMTIAQLADAYFIEHRAKLLDIAAFIDRCERAGGSDVRLQILRQAIPLLVDGRPERAKRILEHFSDPTTDPIAHAGMKGATGVWTGSAGGSR
ncbi:MAG: hypothetical protein AB7G11_04490 [Phycisphaerales bacterium]